MAQNIKKRNPFIQILIGIASTIFIAASLVLFGLAVWGAVLKPEIKLESDSVVVEAGSSFDPMSIVAELNNTTEEKLSIDPASLKTDQAGDYKIVYSADSFPVRYETLDRFGVGWMKCGYTSKTVNVSVRDTTPPELKLVEGPLLIQAGVPVTAEELVVSVSDVSSVKIAFKSGKSEYVYGKTGTKILTVVAEDESGNTAAQEIEIHFSVIDDQPPVITGVEDVVLKVGESFDPMSGVAVTDNLGEDVAVTVTPDSIDTSVPGGYTFTYTSEDEELNRTEVTRNVAVYENVAGEGDGRFGVFWNTAGIANQPYLAAVNRSYNVVTIYGMDSASQYTVPVTAFTCSVGDNTPTGTYTTLEREPWHEMVDHTFGQYSIRIVGHILFHSVPYYVNGDPGSLEYEEYNKLGETASLGCVRLCVEDVKWIYDNCPTGFVTVIYDDPSSPGPLGKPETQKIDLTDEVKRGWDPTDPDVNNPWHVQS